MSYVRGRLRGLAVGARARIGRGQSAQGFYARHVGFGDLAFDVGANIGQHTEMMLKRGARVVAVEPQATLAHELERRFPAATVLCAGVGDEPGEAVLLTAAGNDRLTTLNRDWTEVESGQEWRTGETVEVTTLDALIMRYGAPVLIKIDTEGFEDRVLAGLTRPTQHVMFEVHAALPEVAVRTFGRLDRLASYEYRVMEAESWRFSAPMTPDEILARLPEWGDVHARRLHART